MVHTHTCTGGCVVGIDNTCMSTQRTAGGALPVSTSAAPFRHCVFAELQSVHSDRHSIHTFVIIIINHKLCAPNMFNDAMWELNGWAMCAIISWHTHPCAHTSTHKYSSAHTCTDTHTITHTLFVTTRALKSWRTQQAWPKPLLTSSCSH